MEKEERKVLKGFKDTTDKLKSEKHKKGRHYQVEGTKGAEYTRFPATKRDVDPERIAFLEDEGFIEKAPTDDE